MPLREEKEGEGQTRGRPRRLPGLRRHPHPTHRRVLRSRGLLGWGAGDAQYQQPPGRGLAFDALMLRVFAALAVAWLLSHLVYGVFLAMRPDGSVVASEGEGTASRSRAVQAAPLTGTIVSDGVDAEFSDDDPFALPPLEVAPALGSVGSVDATQASAGD